MSTAGYKPEDHDWLQDAWAEQYQYDKEQAMYFQPPDPEEEPEDEKWERYFDEKENNGYAVISNEEWHQRLDEAMTDGYAEGRIDQTAEFAELLSDLAYLDAPDGGDVSVLEQFRRMSEDARKWREQQKRIDLAIECEKRCEG